MIFHRCVVLLIVSVFSRGSSTELVPRIAGGDVFGEGAKHPASFMLLYKSLKGTIGMSYNTFYHGAQTLSIVWKVVTAAVLV